MRLALSAGLVALATILGGCDDPEEPVGCQTVECVLQQSQARFSQAVAQAQQDLASLTPDQRINIQRDALASASAYSTVLSTQASQNDSAEQWNAWYADRDAFTDRMLEMERRFAADRAAAQVLADQRSVEEKQEEQRLLEGRRQLTIDHQERLRREVEQARQDERFFDDQQSTDERRSKVKEAILAGAYD